MSDTSKSGGDKAPESNEKPPTTGEANANPAGGGGGGGASEDASKASASKSDSSKADGKHQPRQNAPRNEPPPSSDTSKSGGDKAPEEAVRRGYHVVGPGSVTFDGKMYAARKRIDLTDVEAAGLVGLVKLGPPPKIEKPEDVASRAAGKYQVAGPGTVWHDGKPREAGYELHLNEAEARSLGTAIRPV